MRPRSPSLDVLNRRRHALAGLATLSVMWMLIAIGRPLPPGAAQKPALAAMEIALEQVQVPVEPVRPPDPAPAPAQAPAPRAAKAAAPPALTAPATDSAATAPMAPSVAAAPAHAAPATETRPPAPAEPPHAVPAPAPPPAHTPNTAAHAEASFVTQLRALLNAAKRYPTGREASLQRPSGKVTLWFVLARNGQLGGAGIEDSSNSILLDNAALSTVRRASYPALPEAAWPGAPSHRFTVTLDFVAPG